MEKVASRASGGGARLGTLDMQSYLEVMGRQLAEIEAQHHQFYASRQDRLGRVRNQEGQVKSCSSESNSVCQQPGGLSPLEEQAPADVTRKAAQQQHSTPSVDSSSGISSATARSSTVSQGSARRSLHFTDDATSSPASDVAAGGGRSKPSARKSAIVPGTKTPADMRAYNSSPPLTGIGQDAAQPLERGEGSRDARHAHAAAGPSHLQARSRPPRRPAGGTPESASTPASHSISPSTVSRRASTSNPPTPSSSSVHTGAGASPAPGASVTSADTTPAGAYAVYEVSGIASISYSTPQTQDGDNRDSSGASKKPWHASTGNSSGTDAASSSVSISPSPGSRLALRGAHEPSPSAPSADSSAVAVHGCRGGTDGDAESVSCEEGLPFSLALAGQAYDGIDSEEDDEEASSGAVTAAGRGGHSSGADAGEVSFGRVSRDAGQSGDASAKPATHRAVPSTDSSVALSTDGSRPPSRAMSRTPLVVASLETEEALRALLCTPRLARAGSGAPVGASIDVEGVDVPDDVLAALAKTDGMDLQAALDAAMGVSLREQRPAAAAAASGQEKAGTPAAAGPQGRHQHHHALGPGALTAAPPSAASRGFDVSLRSAGNATGRSAVSAGPAAGTPTTVTGLALPASRFAQPHHQEANPSTRLDASMDVDSMDLLSRTIEISSDDLGGAPPGTKVRDSVAAAAVAMAAQRAAAQQPKPVLYSMLPRGPLSPGSAAAEEDAGVRSATADGGAAGGGRRGTGDGAGGKRLTADGGGSKRCTGDGSGLSAEGFAGAVGLSQHPAAAREGQQAAAAAAGVAASLQQEDEAFGSPYRQPRGGAAASPSAASPAVRHGLDGDVVLYGSPNQRSGTGAGPEASAGAGSGGAAPASPLPGGELGQPLVSPHASLGSSRLKRNSRNPIEDVGGLSPAPLAAEVEVRSSVAVVADLAAAPTPSASGAETAPRPWSAAGGGGSRRQMPTSGHTSGPTSVNLDLSLTQAAAAAASGSGRAGAGSAAPSPCGSARHMRVPTPGPLQVAQPTHQPPSGLLQQQQPHSQDGPGPHQPAYSSFSISAVSPSSSKVASYDLSVDETGQPYSPSSSGAAAVAAAAAQAGPAALTASSCRGSRASQAQQQQVAAPPLAAFSRAAAAAAAADLGLAAPPGVGDSWGRQAAATAAAQASEPGPSGSDADEGPQRHAGARGEGESRGVSSGSGSGQQRPYAVRGSAAVEARVAAVGDSYPDLQQDLGQSPGPGSVAASAAKLTQLKARRQQQWQSHHGIQGQSVEGPAAAAGHPPPGSHPGQQQQPRHTDHGSAALVAASAADPDLSTLTPGGPSGRLRGPAPSDSVAAPVTASPAAVPGAASPLLPEAVAEAIVRATNGGQAAASRGELNLGHGITGLSVAIEAGQVKWAWQTDKGGEKQDQHEAAAAYGAAGAYAAGGAYSPGGVDSRDSTLRDSPTGARRGVGDSGSDWALQHLPPPNWQRFGQVPAGSQRLESAKEQAPSAGSRGGAHPHLHQHSHEQQQQPLQRPDPGQYAAMRRHSEYSVVDRAVDRPVAVAGPQSAGGSSVAGGGPPAFRAASASDAGAQGSKALALLRLKQQSIMRHNVSLAGPDPQSQTERQEVQPQRPAPPQYQPYPPEQNGRGRAASADSRNVVSRPQRRTSVPRVPESIAEYGSKAYGSRPAQADMEDSVAGNRGGDTSAGGSQAQPKTFLRRRSAKVQARKVDWSYVKPRTNSRNPDYYADNNSPDVILRTRMSPLTSPKGGVAKPAIGSNAGVRPKKSAAAKQLALSPREEEERAAPSLAAAAARRRGNSNIPAAPLGAAAAGDKRVAGAGAGALPSRGSGLSPLDDLLAHVNTLLRDFDRSGVAQG